MTCRRYPLIVPLCVMKILPRILLPALAVGLLGMAGLGTVPSPTSLEPGSTPRVASAPVHPPDTLHTSAEPGTPLTLTLPATLNGQSVIRYTLLRGPALSGVAGRSFTWIPEGAAPGTYQALLRAESADAPSDTLVVQINFQP